MKVQTSISIKAPIEKVFDVYTDLGKAAERIQGIKDIKILEGSPRIEMGTKWRETRVMFGKEATEDMWVTGLTSNKQYIVEAESHGAHYTSTYAFEEVSEGVQVSMEFSSRPLTVSAKLLGVLFFLFAGATKKALHQDMEDLKKACES